MFEAPTQPQEVPMEYSPSLFGPQVSPPKRDNKQLALIIGVALLAVALIGTTVKIVLDHQEMGRLNASISTLESDKTGLEEDVSGLESELSASDSLNSTLEGQLDQASSTISSYMVCTNGLLKSNKALLSGGLLGSYSALSALRSAKADCIYALKHSELASDDESV